MTSGAASAAPFVEADVPVIGGRATIWSSDSGSPNESGGKRGVSSWRVRFAVSRALRNWPCENAPSERLGRCCGLPVAWVDALRFGPLTVDGCVGC
ncbi:Uncharacterised protein [Burkholderia pseudomallei]|uniref:hypothetical protein n=1 Tax=Burkholderia pseudomallei TaxID=28450 RepID=UPI00039F407D|nr:hypothetical protein [Burkholderia pseudomallei]KGR96071.1 hypothetical protein X977_5630 [Burkholderia pseudomallei MSHR7504]KOT19265.1 hypothetical protein DM52_680 [Burkholderia mallei]KGC37145.1 hypothetical protein DO64_5931 [Burkholderia pseudomallei]KGX48359.1 hypothetical protein Y600_6184 [Burkholderia pseudomallei MSHR3709]ONC37540.1 hypothetical protein AQ915_05465 [Burkholderia pseudomallei]